VAVRVFAPAVVGVRVQPPAATVPTQFTVPSLTVTSPVGVPPVDVTVKVTAMPVPTAEGSGVCPVIVVVVPAAVTACATPPDGLAAKFAVARVGGGERLAPAVVGCVRGARTGGDRPDAAGGPIAHRHVAGSACAPVDVTGEADRHGLAHDRRIGRITGDRRRGRGRAHGVRYARRRAAREVAIARRRSPPRSAHQRS